MIICNGSVALSVRSIVYRARPFLSFGYPPFLTGILQDARSRFTHEMVWEHRGNAGKEKEEGGTTDEGQQER